MYINEFSREIALLGNEKFKKIAKSHVLICGIGGVGGYVCETLARAGIGHFTLVDNDAVSISNINRQVIALHSSLGQCKTFTMKERILDINPKAKVNTKEIFIDESTIDQLCIQDFDFVIDAIDTMAAKLLLIQKAKASNTPIISSMGTANHLDPNSLEITDVFNTSMCPVARIMRRELRKLNIDSLTVLVSKEKPLKPVYPTERMLGSVSFVPSVAGILIAAECIRQICL